MGWVRRVEFGSAPAVATCAALALITTAYTLCVIAAKSPDIPVGLLLSHGALTEAAIRPAEYSRLLTYALLHINFLHVLGNCFCLLLWGVPTEQRLGAANVVLILLVSTVSGALASLFSHQGAFITVGASGAISGLLGALLGLILIGSSVVGWEFIAINLLISVGWVFTNPTIDWMAHAGGFAGGVATVLVLRIAAAMSEWTLRCKFPEFVKVNLLLAALAIGALYFSGYLGPLPAMPIHSLVAACVGGFLVVIKLTDVVLSLKKGLAAVILVLAAANGVVASFATMIALRLNPALCSLPGFEPAALREVLVATCKDPMIAAIAVGAIAAIATLLLYARDFQRGLWDVGFVAATLEANRRRERGL